MLQEVIENSYKTAVRLIDDVEMAILVWDEFGKGFIKKLNVSPDGFLQLTLQLAYYRVSFTIYDSIGKCEVLQPNPLPIVYFETS